MGECNVYCDHCSSLSILQHLSQFLGNNSNSLHMGSLFRFLHSLRSQHTHVDLLGQEVINDCSGHLVVETLLLLRIDIVFIGV